jgi:hypothetical protein
MSCLLYMVACMVFLLRGDILDFFSMYSNVFNTASSAAPQIPVSEDAEIDPRTVATLPLAVRRSNHYGISSYTSLDLEMVYIY